MHGYYSPPIIRSSSDINKRVYIEFYYDDKRIRQYNGNCIGLKLYPNRAKTIQLRDKILKLLRNELEVRLNDGRYHPGISNKRNEQRVSRPFASPSKAKDDAHLITTYKVSMREIHSQFLDFLTKEERLLNVEDLPFERIQEFLSYQQPNTGSIINLQLRLHDESVGNGIVKDGESVGDTKPPR